MVSTSEVIIDVDQRNSFAFSWLEKVDMAHGGFVVQCSVAPVIARMWLPAQW